MTATATAQPPTPTGEYLSVRELADLFRVSVRTVKNWIARREIPYIKLGGRVVFKRSALAEWEKQRTVQAA